jgi:hypothetical protein
MRKRRTSTKIGTFTADDINGVVVYLADIVRKALPPKKYCDPFYRIANWL